ncbi:MAG: OmpA family protein [Nitrospirota bacterium]
MIKKNIFQFVFFLLGINLFLTSAVNAADKGWYLTPGVSYIMEDKDRDADNSVGFQLGVGKPVDDVMNVELTVTFDSLPQGGGNSSEFDQVGLQLDALIFLSQVKKWSTYSVFGVGILRTEFDGNKGGAPMINVGLGVMSPLWKDKVGIRSDVRYRIDERNVYGERSFGDWIVNVGLVVPIGQGKASKAKSENKPAIKIDMASDAPIILKGVNFELGSDQLLPDSIYILDAVAEALRKQPTVAVEVAGHTDSSGSPEFNQELSAKRAEAVTKYLATKGVAAENLKAAGYGADKPIADNATPEGMAQNRRVELNILKR